MRETKEFCSERDLPTLKTKTSTYLRKEVHFGWTFRFAVQISLPTDSTSPLLLIRPLLVASSLTQLARAIIALPQQHEDIQQHQTRTTHSVQVEGQ